MLALPLRIARGDSFPLGFDPVAWIGTPSATVHPTAWLLKLLLVSVGLPFFAVATTAPLLQKWFAGTRHPAAKDPYFLYGASNLGSMLALLSYPTVIEPHLRLTDQSRFWAVGYGVLAALIA